MKGTYLDQVIYAGTNSQTTQSLRKELHRIMRWRPRQVLKDILQGRRLLGMFDIHLTEIFKTKSSRGYTLFFPREKKFYTEVTFWYFGGGLLGSSSVTLVHEKTSVLPKEEKLFIVVPEIP